MNTLFLFAHQDDELGVFFKIHQLIANGDSVTVVYLTSGNFEGERSIVRDSESISVLKQLGVPNENVVFLGGDIGIPDGRLSSNLHLAFHALVGLVEQFGKPAQLYFPAWEGGHQDHDAVHLVGMGLARKYDILDGAFQFPLYTGYKLPGIFFRLFFPLAPNGVVSQIGIPWNLRFKFIKLCFHFPSQKKAWLGLFPFFLWHYLFAGTQMLQTVSTQRVEHQPHSGRLLYERRRVYSFARFAIEVSSFVEEFVRDSCFASPHEGGYN